MLFLMVAITVWAYMTLWFFESLRKKRSDVADIAWGVGFVVAAWSAYLYSKPEGWLAPLVNVLITIWGLRLSIHIYMRNHGRPEDRRYQEMREKWRSHIFLQTYLRVFLVQGILLFIISLPVILVQTNETATLRPWNYFGLGIWVLGFLFEVIGDWQLVSFIRKPENRGQLMMTGLWKYTRHPNYFGEVAQWWGIFLITLVQPEMLLGILGPLTITLLITKISGIPLLEKKMQTNPEFAIYAEHTSIFFPWFSKR